MIKISVVIPMYNSEKTIIRAINSVLTQEFEELEIIIVNDGSKDESQKAVEDYISKNSLNSKIKLINKKNGGVSTARNQGMKLSKGDYIAFLDSDDEWLQGKLKEQISYMERNKNVLMTGTTMNGHVFKKFFCKNFSETTEITLKNLLFKNFFQPSTVIIRKEIIAKIGYFDENQRYAEEGNYFYRIANKYKCVLINKSFLNFGDGKPGFGHSGLSGNLKEMEKGELKNLKFAYNQNYISRPLYTYAIIYSVLKYLRRLVIVKLNIS